MKKPKAARLADLRIRVFTQAAKHHPLVRAKSFLFASNENAVKSEIATSLGKSWEKIEGAFFSDVFELQRLKAFCGYASADAFLSRYNEAQIQASLYSATQIQVIAQRDFRAIVMAGKRAMLIHEAERLSDNVFRFTFYGPVAPLRTTKRYGVLLARMIPRLLACKEWELRASIQFYPRGKQPELRIASTDHYQSSVSASPEFDSGVERAFAEKWGMEPRNGWRLERESEPRFMGQKAFFPDFTFVHESGCRILMEIVGHWTPEYLQAKRKSLRLFSGERILLAVGAGEAEEFLETGAEIIRFKKVLKIEPVLEALGRMIQVE